MVYIKTKPDSGKSPKLDAPIIKDNFFTYNTIFSNNHTPLNDINQGDHEEIIFETQTVDPDITTNIDILYSRDATSNVGTQPQIFLKIPQFLPKTPDNSTSLNTRMQLTYSTVNVIGPQYQSFLWGTIDPSMPTATGAYMIFFGSVSNVTSQTLVTSDVIVLTNPPTTLLLTMVQSTTTFLAGAPLTGLNSVINSNSTFTISVPAISSVAPTAYTVLWLAIGTV